MRSAELTCPLYAATLSDPRRERRPPRGCLQANELALGQAQSERGHSTALRRHPPRATAGSCPPLRCYRARGRMGARVMASGMPGASRRAVLGGATYSVVKVWIRLSGAGRPGSVTISATSLARVQRGGVNPGPCARGFGAMSLWPVSDWPVGRRLKLALRGEYSTSVLGYVKSDCNSQGKCKNPRAGKRWSARRGSLVIGIVLSS